MEMKEIKLNDAKWYNNIEKWVGMITIAVALVLLTYQVVLRFVFNSANSWSEELSKYLYIYFVFYTASYGVYKAGQIRIDAFLNVWPKKIRKYVVLFGWLMVLVYAIAVVIYSSAYMYSLYDADQMSLGLRMPMWIFFFAIPSAHVFMTVRCLQNLYIFAKTKGEFAVPLSDSEAEEALQQAQEAEKHAQELAEKKKKAHENGGETHDV